MLAGIVPLSDQPDRSETARRVETMGRIQAHRAPAGWRVAARPRLAYVVEHNEVGREETPEGFELAFDGVITNREALRKALAVDTDPAGQSGSTDRALLARAWRRWGEGCLERIDGRFAFLVHDPASGTSFLARDRFGHRPLHYALREGQLCFASEIKTLSAVLPAPELDELALLEWSFYGDLLPPRTLLRGIRTLAPGHVLKVSERGAVQETRAYYDTTSAVDAARYAEYAERSPESLLPMLEDAVDHAVSGHIGGREEVGVMLSGGVDSTIIAAFAARHARVKAYNFSVAGDSRLDEQPMARQVADRLGIPLQSFVVDGRTYRQELAQTTWLYEMPLWHMQGVPIELLARRARADGTAILLSGVSVGPLLGAAMDRYRWILPPPFLSRVPDDVFRIVRKAVYSASGLSIANPFFALNLGVGLQLVDGGERARRVERYDQAYGFLKDPHQRRVHVMRICDNALFLARFFHQGDRLCMGHSVEYCDAAVDQEFMSMALNFPTEAIFHKKRTSKWVLKELATRFVPREVAFQKKIPLDVPLAEYFEPPFRKSLFKDGFLASFLGLDWNAATTLADRARERRPLLFQLVNLETWGRMFLMQQSVEEVRELLSH